MALSYVTYSATGGTNYSVPFGYVINTDVAVYVDSVLQTEGAGNDYTWFNATTIQFTAGSTPTPGQLIVIRRTTEQATRLVDFQDAGNLTEYDLDLSANQLFYLVQEGLDNTNDLSMQLDTDNKWNAETYIIKNVGDPVSAQDAVTKNWAETSMTSQLALAIAAKDAADADVVLTHADAAATAADAAATAADAIATAADRVQTGLDAAATAADRVQTGLDAAATAADRVQTGLDAAATAADAIATAADAVSTAADAASTAADAISTALDVTYAAEWANKAEDSLVSVAAGGDGVDDYSALHWANKAQGYAASLTLPSMSGQALKFLRANAGETSLEYFNLFGTANTWTATPTVQASGGSFIIAKAYDVAHDSAFNGHLTKASDDTSRGFFGSIPSDPGSYIAAYTWDDTLGTPAWNRVFGADRDAVAMQLTAAGADLPGTLRATSYLNPTSGSGIELGYSAGTGYLTSYDRTGSGYLVTAVRGSLVAFHTAAGEEVRVWNDSGVSVLQVKGSGIARLVSEGAAGYNSGVQIREDNKHKLLMGWDATNHWATITRYRDSDQATLSQIWFYDSGDMTLSTTGGTYTCTLSATGTLTNIGSIVSTSGNLASNNGSVYSNAQTAGNSHFWLQEGGANRSVLYYDITGNSTNLVKYRESDAAVVGHLFMGDGGQVILSGPSSGITLNASGNVTINDSVASKNLVIGNGTSTGRVTWGGPAMEAYSVRLSNTGTKVTGHSNFSTSKTATGVYRITHNLGVNHACIAQPEGTGGATLTVKSNYVSANVVDLYVQATASGAATDSALSVIFVPSI